MVSPNASNIGRDKRQFFLVWMLDTITHGCFWYLLITHSVFYFFLCAPGIFSTSAEVDICILWLIAVSLGAASSRLVLYGLKRSVLTPL